METFQHLMLQMLLLWKLPCYSFLHLKFNRVCSISKNIYLVPCLVRKASCSMFEKCLHCLSSIIFVYSWQSEEIKTATLQESFRCSGTSVSGNCISFFLFLINSFHSLLLKEKVADVCRNWLVTLFYPFI